MINPYCTLQDAKDWGTGRGQAMGADGIDDGIIEDIIEGVSRYFDEYTGRTFYPRYETRRFTVPHGQNDNSILFVDDDLLEVVTITNGDATSLASTEYYLKPHNFSPAYALQMIETSNYNWEPTSAGAYTNAIQIAAWWGFHNRYSQRAWTSGGTLGAAMADTTTASATLTAGHSIRAGDIVKIGTEIFNVSAVTATTATFNQRGDNGSTAATHLISTVVYKWNPITEIKQACLQSVLNVYASRTGQSSSGRVTITGAGVVIRPDDIPQLAMKTLEGLVRQ